MQALTNLLHKLNANRFKKLAGTETKSQWKFISKGKKHRDKVKTWKSSDEAAAKG